MDEPDSQAGGRPPEHLGLLVAATLRLETGQYHEAAELLDSVDLDAVQAPGAPPDRRRQAEEELAALLHQLRAVASWRIGHHDRAVVQMRVAMRRARSPELGSANFRTTFADHLCRFAELLSGADRQAEAIRVTEEAVDVLAVLPPCKDQVRALRLLGQQLRGVDRGGAVRAVERLTVIRRALGGGVHAVRHGESGMTTGDQVTAADAALTRVLAEDRPLPDLAEALTGLAAALRADGRYAEALEPAAEAVAVHRRLAAAGPNSRLRGLAAALLSWFGLLDRAGRPAEAAAVAAECAQLFDQVGDPDAARIARGQEDRCRERHRWLDEPID